jgi:hypothetical protein
MNQKIDTEAVRFLSELKSKAASAVPPSRAETYNIKGKLLNDAEAKDQVHYFVYLMNLFITYILCKVPYKIPTKLLQHNSRNIF